MTKAYDITTPKFSVDFGTLEATMPFFSERSAGLKMLINFVLLY